MSESIIKNLYWTLVVFNLLLIVFAIWLNCATIRNEEQHEKEMKRLREGGL